MTSLKDAPSPTKTTRTWAKRAALVGLPVVLALVGYYGPVLRGAPLPRLGGDGAFYVYQLDRARELGGQWWGVAADDRLGDPYPPITAKHPGIFEGVDLMLVGSLTGQFLDPTANFHAMTLLTLAANGWVAAWLVHRLTGSYGWAAMGVALLTLNDPTAGRVGGHLHLYKFGWILLALCAFARYLEAPSNRRGVWLGLAMAGVLQGSFYLGFLLGVGLGAWWLGTLVAGKLGRAHLTPTLLAGLTFGLAGGLLTFPVWWTSRRAELAGDYFIRQRFETWLYGSELWQYFTPPTSKLAADYVAAFHQKQLGAFWEGWYYPGRVVLLAVAACALARLRGVRLCRRSPAAGDLALGLIGVFVLLSLAGGPGFLIHQWFPGFRCYGRAGLIALMIGCVMAPVVWQRLLAAIPRRGLRTLARVGLLALTFLDARAASDRFFWAKPQPDPAWSSWLADQPSGVRLAAFATPTEEPFAWWGMVALEQRRKHGHRTLNGAEFAMLEGDLRLLGASYERMTPDGLRLVVTLGYDTLAFDSAYLAAHPWIDGLPWLDRLADQGGWTIFRANDRTPRFPRTETADLLARLRATETRAVPASTWITGKLPLDGDTVVVHPGRVRMAWEDADGRRVGLPLRALFQHVLGPELAAFSVETPARPGPYRLAFLDDQGRSLATLPFRIDPGQRAGRSTFGTLAEGGDGIVVDRRGGSTRLILENRGTGYLQAQAHRDPSLGVARTQPGMFSPASGSLVVRVGPQGRLDEEGMDWLLPTDLPGDGRLELTLPAGVGGDGERVEVRPRILWPGSAQTPTWVAVKPAGAAEVARRTVGGN